MEQNDWLEIEEERHDLQDPQADRKEWNFTVIVLLNGSVTVYRILRRIEVDETVLFSTTLPKRLYTEIVQGPFFWHCRALFSLSFSFFAHK